MITAEHIKCAKSYVPIRCNICKYQWQVSINHKDECPNCAGAIPWALDRLLMKVRQIHDDKYNYSLIKENHIQNVRSYIPLICNCCPYYWTPTIYGHMHRKTGCPSCKISKGELECRNVLLKLNIPFSIQFDPPNLEKIYILYLNMMVKQLTYRNNEILNIHLKLFDQVIR